MKPKGLIIAAALLALSTLCLAGNWELIVNKTNPVENISAEDLKRIYLGEKISWPSGKRIKVASIKKGDACKEFLDEIVKLSPMRFSRHWQKIVFTGNGTPIKLFKTDAQVKAFIRDNPTAVGCIAKQSLDDSVKKIKVLKKNKAYKSTWKL